MEEKNIFSETQLDALKEVGNIGSGNACTALSVLMGVPVDMAIPSIHLLDYESTPDYLGGADQVVMGIAIDMTDGLEGMLFQVIQKSFVDKIINTFYEKKLDSIEDIDEMDSSVLNEMGNITCGVYTNAISGLTGLPVNISTPTQYVDKVENILKVPLNRFQKLGDKIFCVDEILVIGGEEEVCNMIMILERDSYHTLFQKLDV